ncbi:ATP/GTP-binding protein [Leptolyngbya sp. FACHB-541]|uniref:GTP-binding protein n=1 Tax=Leptolyngbya sp. FACHB-541 TaxID=2692810 RepID=UPI001688233E|nr:ATP/GTP-binding protein [Leptolyngbya sp. FACHB-541]MBD2000819.1 ATP/GTP-binding protein [Leptolyngbya sp. FACHB-541]
MRLMRLVVTGTAGAGKSTFVRTVSDIEAIDTDRAATDETAQIKQKTTVAFDFGRLSFGPRLEIHIYGTPGQSRFNFMWDILIQRANAYVLLVAAHRIDELVKARQIIAFMNERVQIPMVIGLTHRDCPGARSPEEIAMRLGYTDLSNLPTIVTVNPNEKNSVLETLNVMLMSYLMSQLAPDLNTVPARQNFGQEEYRPRVQIVR